MNLEKLHETNHRKLKEKLGLLPTYSKRFHRYMDILVKGLITKQEVISLKAIFGGGKKNNLTDTEVSEMISAYIYPILVLPDNIGHNIKITKEHTEQGLKFLKSLYLTPKGARKKTNRLNELTSTDGYDVNIKEAEDILNNFSHFQFNGFYEDCSYHQTIYKPVWAVIAKDGEFFEYVQEMRGYERL